MKNIIGLRALGISSALALGGIAAPATAAVQVFKASNYTGGAHGLWTNTLNTGSARFYAFQNDVVFTLDTDTGIATLKGTAINDAATVAKLDLTFTNPLDSLSGSPYMYKQESGIAYDADTDSPDIDFFTGATGSITIGSTTHTLQSNPFAGGTVFQYGTGANAKNTFDYGGSSWLLVDGRRDHFDINFRLTAVPEPATWAMLILGFGVIGGAMRRSGQRGTAAPAIA